MTYYGKLFCRNDTYATSQPSAGQSTSCGDVQSSWGGEQASGTGVGAHKGHPGTPMDRGRSDTATQNAGATPGGMRASAVDKEEGGNQDSGNREVERRGWESMRIGGSNNKGDGLASQPRRYRVPGQPLLNRHQVGGASRSPDGFAQQEGVPTRGRPAVRGKGTPSPPQPTPHTNTSNPPRGAQVPPNPPVVPPARPIVPLHRHCAQQEHWPSRRPIDPTGGSSGTSDSQWASQAPGELRKMMSARRGWGTQRANPRAPAAQRLCPSTLRGTCTQWATIWGP